MYPGFGSHKSQPEPRKSKQFSIGAKNWDIYIYIYIVRAEIRAYQLLLLWFGESTYSVLRIARWAQASEPSLTAFGLAAKRRTECASVNLFWYFVLCNGTDCCCCCRLRFRIHGELRAECGYLGL